MTTHSLDRVRSVRLGAAALNQTPLDWEGNAPPHRATAIDEARAAGAGSMLCLPEIAITGYGCEDTLPQSPNTLRQTCLARSLRWTSCPPPAAWWCAVGLPVLARRAALQRRVALIADGALLGHRGQAAIARGRRHPLRAPLVQRPGRRACATRVDAPPRARPVPIG
jgi:NAD+ synthase (glutamine-hydrolysing)